MSPDGEFFVIPPKKAYTAADFEAAAARLREAEGMTTSEAVVAHPDDAPGFPPWEEARQP